MFRFFVYPFLTLSNNLHSKFRPNDSETPDNLKQNEEKMTLKMMEALEKVNPNIEQPEFIHLYSLDELILEKQELLKKIKSTTLEKLERTHQNPIPHLTHMLYAFHITKELEKRKHVKFTENQHALIDAYHKILKLKYSFWIRNL